MAKLIGKIGTPVDYRGDWQAEEAEQLSRFSKQFMDKNKGDTVGEVVKWPRADGYACYMVVSEKPLQLALIDHGDAWQIEDALIRGLRIGDIRELVKHERAITEMFSRKAS